MTRNINHNQRGVLGTTVIALIVASLFYIPWRVEKTGDIAYAPFYRGPVKSQAYRMEEIIGSSYIRLDGNRIWWLYGLQLMAIAGAGAVAFHVMDKPEDQAGLDEV